MVGVLFDVEAGVALCGHGQDRPVWGVGQEDSQCTACSAEQQRYSEEKATCIVS